jgi:hypothetical protein
MKTFENNPANLLERKQNSVLPDEFAYSFAGQGPVDKANFDIEKERNRTRVKAPWLQTEMTAKLKATTK